VLLQHLLGNPMQSALLTDRSLRGVPRRVPCQLARFPVDR